MIPVPLARLIEKWRTNEVIGDRSKQTFIQCASELEALLAEQEQQPVVAWIMEFNTSYGTERLVQIGAPTDGQIKAAAGLGHKIIPLYSSPQPAKEAGATEELPPECPSCGFGCGGTELYYYCHCCERFLKDGEYVDYPEHLRAHEGWQPIETAPPRTHILIWANAWAIPTIGFLHPNHGWVDTNNEHIPGDKPTLWAPLLAAPKP